MHPDPHERHIIQEEVVRTPRGVDSNVFEQRTHIEPTPAERQLSTLYRAKQIVWLIVGLIVSLIALRFVLLLLGANTGTGFGEFIISITQPFVAPFLPLFGEGRVELGDLVAIIVYLLVGWGLSKLLEIMLTPQASSTRY